MEEQRSEENGWTSQTDTVWCEQPPHSPSAHTLFSKPECSSRLEPSKSFHLTQNFTFFLFKKRHPPSSFPLFSLVAAMTLGKLLLRVAA